jgi:hypothetical protein
MMYITEQQILWDSGEIAPFFLQYGKEKIVNIVTKEAFIEITE